MEAVAINPPAPTPIRLLIVDDHEVVRIGLRALFSAIAGMNVVGDARTATEAVALAETLEPDVVLMDVRLPDDSGLNACRKIQQLGGDTKVLILTSYADEKLVEDAKAAGADGYLLKEVDSDKLTQAVQQVAAGISVLDSALSAQLQAKLDVSSAGPGTEERISRLSPQELRVLALVARGQTNPQIASALGLSAKTVKNYFSNVLDKLEVARRAEAAALYVQNEARRA